jgi:hypothetical protein
MRRHVGRVDHVSPNVLRFVEGCDHVLVFVVNRQWDVLAQNPLAVALYEGLNYNDNLIRLTFLNPAAREFYLTGTGGLVQGGALARRGGSGPRRPVPDRAGRGALARKRGLSPAMGSPRRTGQDPRVYTLASPRCR